MAAHPLIDAFFTAVPWFFGIAGIASVCVNWFGR